MGPAISTKAISTSINDTFRWESHLIPRCTPVATDNTATPVIPMINPTWTNVFRVTPVTSPSPSPI